MNQRLGRACESIGPDLVRFVQQLASVRSYSFDEERVADRVRDALKNLDYDLVFRDGVGNAVGILAGSTEGPVLLLTTHMDTVRPPDVLHGGDHRSGCIRRGRIYGVGTAACKGALAVQIYGGQVLRMTSPFFRGTLVVAATVAEHDGCGVGTTHLLRHTLPELGLEPTLMILGEPTGLELRHCGDGRAEILTSVAGSDDEAVRGAAELVFRRLTLPNVLTVGTRSATLQVAPPDYSRKPGMPFEARLKTVCRVPPGMTVEDCLRWIRDRAHLNDGGLTIDVEIEHELRGMFTGKVADVLHSSEPWSTDPSSPVVRHACEPLQTAEWNGGRRRARPRRNPRNRQSPGNSSRYGVPTLGFGPGDASLVQAPLESVSIDEIRKGVFGTALLARAVLDTRGVK